MKTKPGFTTKGLGFFLYIATAIFLIALMVFVSNEIKLVTPERIDDCNSRIETYQSDLEKAQKNNDSESEIKKIDNKIAAYKDKIEMLQKREGLYFASMVFIVCVLLLCAFLQSVKTSSFQSVSSFGLSSAKHNYYHFLSAPICAMCILLAVGVTYRTVFSLTLKDVIMLVGSVVVGAITFFVYRKSPYISASVRTRRVKDTTLTYSDILFFLPIAGIAVLLFANFVFGVTINGAKLWIDLKFTMLQPGEIIKVLLIIVFASAYGKTWRAITAFATGVMVALAMLALRDMGTAMVVFTMIAIMMFLLLDNKMTFSLYEHKKLLIIVMILAVCFFFVALAIFPYARERFSNVGHAMENGAHSQQADMLKAMVFGGLGGLGIKNSSHILNIFAIENDMAIAGMTSVFGFGMLFLVLLCYALIIVIPLRKHSLYREFYFASAQVSIVLLAQVALNALGAVDILPFTGIVAPFISDGGSALMSFCAMMGILLATLHPSIKPLEVDH